MKTGKPYPIKVWLERSGNKFVVNGHAQDWIEGAKNVDLIVHMFLYPTSFSCYADILLPATEWLETNMLVECMNWVFARQPSPTSGRPRTRRSSGRSSSRSARSSAMKTRSAPAIPPS